MLKVQVLLAAPERAVLDAARAALVEANWTSQAADTVARVWVLVPGATDGLPHAAALGGDPKSFGAMLDLTGPTCESVLPLVTSLRRVLRPIAAQSVVLAGTEHVLAPGEDACQFLVVLAPLPSLSQEAFHTYWLEHHARVVRPGRSGRGYRQFHADPDASRIIGQAIGLSTRGFEGTATGYVPDLATFRTALGDAQRLAPILEDERRFIDHTRTAIGLYEELALDHAASRGG
jgi:hypothetical protein